MNIQVYDKIYYDRLDDSYDVIQEIDLEDRTVLVDRFTSEGDYVAAISYDINWFMRELSLNGAKLIS